MDVPNAAQTPVVTDGAIGGAYEAFWNCMDADEPVSLSADDDHRTAYEQFWKLSDAD